MTRHTAILIIEGGDQITCDASGPDPENGKYASWITFWKDNRPHISPLMQSDYRFDTGEEAKVAAEELVKDIREKRHVLLSSSAETPTRAIVVPFQMFPHASADLLSVVPVGTTNYVARTKDWLGVTRAVYIPDGSTVDTSRPEFAWLETEGSTVTLKPRKLRGVLSTGLMVRVPDDTPLGEDWTEKLGVSLAAPSEGAGK